MKMTTTDYPAFVRKIWSDPLGVDTERGLSIAGMGIVGEACEVAELLCEEAVEVEKLVDECGDVLYYTTVLAGWKGFTLDDLVSELTAQSVEPRLAALMLCRDAKDVSERVKKFVRDGADPDAYAMLTYLGLVVFSLDRMLRAFNRDIQDALNANVAKLAKRYCVECGEPASRCPCKKVA